MSYSLRNLKNKTTEINYRNINVSILLLEVFGTCGTIIPIKMESRYSQLIYYI